MHKDGRSEVERISDAAQLLLLVETVTFHSSLRCDGLASLTYHVGLCEFLLMRGYACSPFSRLKCEVILWDERVFLSSTVSMNL